MQTFKEETRVEVDEYSEGYVAPVKPRWSPPAFNGGSEMRVPLTITPQPHTIEARLPAFDPRTIPGVTLARNITPLQVEPIELVNEDPFKDIPF